MDSSITIVNVGDGACSILRSPWWWPMREVTIIDCGVWRASPQTAADRLLSALGRDLSNVTSVIVSHFDTDHWEGFASFARSSAASTLDKLTVYYPAMPATIPQGVLAFVNQRGQSGVDALDLKRVLSPLVVDPDGIDMRPLSRDDTPWVEIAGRGFRVLWPPARLSPQNQRTLWAAVQDVRNLADDLAADGDDTLSKNLAALERDPFVPSRRDDDVQRHESEEDPALTRQPTLAGEEPDAPGREAPDEVDEPEFTDTPDIEPLISVPPAYRTRFQRVVRRIRRANNDLSLILAAEDGFLVCLGDAGESVLRHVAQDLRNMYGEVMLPHVMLAPHHGSYPVPSDFPPAFACVAQAGKRHYGRWGRHLGSHGNWGCMTTHESGTLTFLSL